MAGDAAADEPGTATGEGVAAGSSAASLAAYSAAALILASEAKWALIWIQHPISQLPTQSQPQHAEQNIPLAVTLACAAEVPASPRAPFDEDAGSTEHAAAWTWRGQGGCLATVQCSHSLEHP